MDSAERLNVVLRENQASKQRALTVMRRLRADAYMANAIQFYEQSIRQRRAFYLLPDLLNFIAYELHPKSYLEIGVRWGRSMAQVVAESPQTEVFGFDMWIPNYAGQENPGPEFVCDQMKAAGATKSPQLISGNSHQTVPQFFRDYPGRIDIITVDGDHTYLGAKRDLDTCFANLADGGLLIFDDLYHQQFPELAGLWTEYKAKYPDYWFIEDKTATGTAIAIKPPFRRYEALFKKFG